MIRAIVFARVFNEPVGQIADAGLRRAAVFNLFHDALVALGFDEISAVLHTLFHKCNNLRLGFELISLGVVSVTCFLSTCRVRKEIHRSGRMQQVTNERARVWMRFVVVFVFGQIFSDCNQLAADFIPRFEKGLRWARGRLGWGLFSVHLCASRRCQKNDPQGDSYKRQQFLHGFLRPAFEAGQFDNGKDALPKEKCSFG